MFNVTVRGPDGSETSYPLGADQGLLIGRDESCDIVLASKRISRRHARFFTSEGKLHVEDLGSQNGVFVGGARIAGTVEIRPGPPIEIGEFNLRIRREDLNAAENSYAGMLQGFGSMEGRTLALPRERGVVGRDNSADIIIASDSVSRRHAELHFTGVQGYYVQDLASANGTYVNGVRLPPKIERPLRPGDRVQFGDTGWLVVPKSALATPVSEKSRRRVLLVLLVFLILMTAGVVLLLQHPLGTTPAVPAGDTVHIQASSIDRCNQALQDQKWEDAQRSCAEAYDEEPFLDRRQLLRKAQHELGNKQIYDDAAQKASIGSDREAIERYTDLEPGSSYFPQARLQVQQIAKGLMRADDNACLDAGRKHNNDKALVACANYLRYQCQNGIDQDALKILRAAEEKRHSGEPWQCPTTLAVWFKSGLGRTADRDTYCKPKYEDKDVCDAIVHYAHQEAEDAQRSLAKVKKGKTTVDLDALRQAISTVDGQYKAGQSAFTANDFAGTEKDYKIALASDALIMQKGVESDYAKSMRDTLVAHYRQAGDQAKDRGHYDEAFNSYSQGAKYRPSLYHNIDDLETVAADNFSHSQTCDTARAVENYTRDNSRTHVEAAQFIVQNHCP